MHKFLPKSVAITLANALVSSRLNYCNSLLRDIKDQDLRRRQGIQTPYALLFQEHLGTLVSLRILGR